MFNVVKEEYWKSLIKPSDGIDFVIEIMIVVLLFYDVFSPLSKISDYMQLAQSVKSVISDLSFERLLVSYSM